MKLFIVSASAKVAALALAALVVGCASTSNVRSTAVDSTPESKRDGRFEVDAERIARIEAAARVTGTQVHWVNLPRKRVD